jgi:6,7-dimethyl-8-ribityllumazine synthase
MSLNAPKGRSVDGTLLSIGIAAARFNGELVDALLTRTVAVLRSAGVREEAVTVVRVPGSHEIPWAAQMLARGGRDCVIGLGVLIGGDTSHHELVGQSVSHALQRVSLETRVPVINGVIVADTLEQARARCSGTVDRGSEFARAALEMATLARRFSS